MLSLFPCAVSALGEACFGPGSVPGFTVSGRLTEGALYRFPRKKPHFFPQETSCFFAYFLTESRKKPHNLYIY